MIALALTLALVASRPAIEVDVDGCPGFEEAVIERLPSNIRRGLSVRSDGSKRIDLELRTASGALIARKTIEDSRGCAERAETVSLVLETWSLDLALSSPPPARKPKPMSRSKAVDPVKETVGPEASTSGTTTTSAPKPPSDAPDPILERALKPSPSPIDTITPVRALRIEHPIPWPTILTGLGSIGLAVTFNQIFPKDDDGSINRKGFIPIALCGVGAALLVYSAVHLINGVPVDDSTPPEIPSP
jgi:hypothetical protein